MLTDAQKRARDRYDKLNTRNVAGIKFSRNEYDLADYLSSKPNRARFLKELLRKAMEEEQEEK